MTRNEAIKILQGVVDMDENNDGSGHYGVDDILNNAGKFYEAGRWGDGTHLTSDEMEALETIINS
jgi:hypothetical protein